VSVQRAHASLAMVLAAFLIIIALTTQSTSNIPGGDVWQVLGLMSAAGFVVYVLRPSVSAAAWAVGAFLTQSIPRALIWLSEWAIAPAAIWAGWSITVVMWWADRPRETERQ
jgi:hypothetical protein